MMTFFLRPFKVMSGRFSSHLITFPGTYLRSDAEAWHLMTRLITSYPPLTHILYVLLIPSSTSETECGEPCVGKAMLLSLWQWLQLWCHIETPLGGKLKRFGFVPPLKTCEICLGTRYLPILQTRADKLESFFIIVKMTNGCDFTVSPLYDDAIPLYYFSGIKLYICIHTFSDIFKFFICFNSW